MNCPLIWWQTSSGNDLFHTFRVASPPRCFQSSMTGKKNARRAGQKADRFNAAIMDVALEKGVPVFSLTGEVPCSDVRGRQFASLADMSEALAEL